MSEEKKINDLENTEINENMMDTETAEAIEVVEEAGTVETEEISETAERAETADKAESEDGEGDEAEVADDAEAADDAGAEDNEAEAVDEAETADEAESEDSESDEAETADEAEGEDAGNEDAENVEEAAVAAGTEETAEETDSEDKAEESDKSEETEEAKNGEESEGVEETVEAAVAGDSTDTAPENPEQQWYVPGPVTQPTVQTSSFSKGRLAAGIVFLALFAGACGAYTAKAYTYQDRFIKGTSINGIDVSEMNLEQAEELVKNQVEDYSIEIAFPEGKTETISASDVGLSYVSDGSVQELLETQNRFAWAAYLIDMKTEREASENYTIDESALEKAVSALPEFKKGSYTVSKDACMEITEENTIAVVPETYGTQLDVETVVASLAQAISERQDETAIDESYYILPEVYADDQNLNKVVGELNTFLNTTITWTLHDGTTYTLDAETLKDWLTEEEGSPSWYYVDDEVLKEKSVELAAEIAGMDNAEYTTFPFKSTKRGTVNIACSSYGCTVDETAEAEQIYQDIIAGGAIERKPNYSRTISYPVGDTYIEVDIINQKVYLYKNGKLVVESSCVTGTDTVASRRSDRGLFHVTWRVKDYTMYGEKDASGKPSYASFVNFAVFYNGGEALHDASWRSSFGGTTYLYSGSHGCINMPYDKAKAVYENSYEGMPVIVFD